MRKLIYIILTVSAFSAVVTYWGMRSGQKSLELEALEMQAVVEEKEKQLLGYTKYTNYLAVGKQALSGSMKLVTATVVRSERVTQLIDRTVLGVPFSATVLITHQSEYSFGFDLRPDQYDVKAAATGIEVHVRKPSLVATPAVTKLQHRVLSGSLLTDEQAAALKLYERAATRVKAQGVVMALEPAIMALCEKQLERFLREFLAKQPGVTVVPNITIVYIEAAAK